MKILRKIFFAAMAVAMLFAAISCSTSASGGEGSKIIRTKKDYIGTWTTKNSKGETITTIITDDKVNIMLDPYCGKYI